MATNAEVLEMLEMNNVGLGTPVNTTAEGNGEALPEQTDLHGGVVQRFPARQEKTAAKCHHVRCF